MKTIPPYKPIPADNGSSDSSPEKESDNMVKAGVSGKRKGTGKATTATSVAVGVKGGATGAKTVVGGHSPSLSDASSIGAGGDTADITKSSNPSVGPKDASNLSATAVMGTLVTSSTSSGTTKFTTSNFVETVVTQSESVFGADISTVGQANVRVSSATVPSSSISSTGNSSITGKKRKAGGSRTPTTPDNLSDIASMQAPVPVVSGTAGIPTLAGSVTAIVGNVSVSSSGGNDSTVLGDSKKLKLETGGICGISANSSNPMPLSTITESVVVTNINSRPLSGNVITSASTGSVNSAVSAGSIVVSVPLAATSIQPPTSSASTVVTSAPTLFQQLQQSSVVTSNAALLAAANASAAESRAQAVAHQQTQHIGDQPGKRARLVDADPHYILATPNIRKWLYKHVNYMKCL